LRGYVGHPSQSRSSTKGQYLFVGGRYVRDRALSHALAEAYRGLLMVGRQPVAILFLDLPAEDVDVNVHPMKIEVRFRDSHRVYSQLLATIRQTFLASDLHTQLQLGSDPSQAERSTASGSSSRATVPVDSVSPAVRAVAVDREDVARWFSPSEVSFSTAQAWSHRRPASEPDWARNLPPAPVPDRAGPFDEFEPSARPTAATQAAARALERGSLAPTTGQRRPGALADRSGGRGPPGAARGKPKAPGGGSARASLCL
ncbi:MAG: hypothetical protein K6T35_09535, partial [Meiothermus silvanus]|nr:hypothetical protein [Allomeiothermus silvanus]